MSGRAIPWQGRRIDLSTVIRLALTHSSKLTSLAGSGIMVLRRSGCRSKLRRDPESESWSSGTFLSPLTADSHYIFAVLYA
jgi:hypothetical protein